MQTGGLGIWPLDLGFQYLICRPGVSVFELETWGVTFWTADLGSQYLITDLRYQYLICNPGLQVKIILASNCCQIYTFNLVSFRSGQCRTNVPHKFVKLQFWRKNLRIWGSAKKVFEGFPNHPCFLCRSNHKNLHSHALTLALLDNWTYDKNPLLLPLRCSPLQVKISEISSIVNKNHQVIQKTSIPLQKLRWGPGLEMCCQK